jgi:opacity protein-like surface antigen
MNRVDTKSALNSGTGWWIALATLVSSTTAHAADPGFYFGASVSRVEHEVEGWPGVQIAVFTPAPGAPIPPPLLGGISDLPPSFFLPVPIALQAHSIDVDDVDTGFSAMAGYRINRYLAAELSFADFGEYRLVERYSFGTLKYEIGVRGLSASVLGTLPVSERWELFLRGGMLFADQQVSFSAVSSSPGTNPSDRDYSNEAFMAGAGVQWSFLPALAVRLEYQRTDDLKYDNTGESSIEQASLSILFKL